MKVDVKLPELGADVAGDQATVSFFFVDEGDSIGEGEDLVEMMTDKASFKVPSPASGKVVKILAKEDEVVKVGGMLAVIETKD